MWVCLACIVPDILCKCKTGCTFIRPVHLITRHGWPRPDGAVSPQDVVTTVYHCLGIATDTELTDALGRPYRLCQGSVIRSILA